MVKSELISEPTNYSNIKILKLAVGIKPGGENCYHKK